MCGQNIVSRKMQYTSMTTIKIEQQATNQHNCINPPSHHHYDNNRHHLRFNISLMLIFTKLLCLTTNSFVSNHWPTNSAHTARSIDERSLCKRRLLETMLTFFRGDTNTTAKITAVRIFVNTCTRRRAIHHIPIDGSVRCASLPIA